MSITEELIAQAQNFDKGSALRSLLERAANYITGLERTAVPTAAPERAETAFQPTRSKRG